jgi:two-component system, response regulator PdtaR
MLSELKILIVEDEIISAMHLQLQLSKRNYEICTKAVSGQEAINIALVERPDVILIDMRLAGKLDGNQTILNIQAHYNPIVIFMTGYQDEVLIEKVKLLNPAGILIKPFEIDDIDDLIIKALKNKFVS